MDRWKRQTNVLGVLGVHVDDLVGGGNLVFQKAVQWLRTELEFGTLEQGRFRLRGRELCQDFYRKSIKISTSKFVQEMEPVAVPKYVKDELDAPLKANVHSQFRGGVGQLQWLQSQGNPLLSFATGILQSRSATPNGHDLFEPQQVDARCQIDAGSLLVDCFSAVIICLAHGRRRSLGKSP